MNNTNIDGYTRLIGIMATPIRHSLSPTMHNTAFQALGLNYAYLAFEVDQDHLASGVEAIKTLAMRGINVSMPNKHAIMQYLDHVDVAAELTGSVNTVVNDDGVLTGYTTDGAGFVNDLKRKGHPIQNQRLVVAGAGGAGIAICAQAALSGAKQIQIFNRRSSARWQLAEQRINAIRDRTDCQIELVDLTDQSRFQAAIEAADIYCDATGVGMGKLINKSLVEAPSWFHSGQVVYDTIYAPRRTKLMQIAAQTSGTHVYNGLGMLIEQGAAAFQLWTGQEMPIELVQQAIERKEADQNA